MGVGLSSSFFPADGWAATSNSWLIHVKQGKQQAGKSVRRCLQFRVGGVLGSGQGAGVPIQPSRMVQQPSTGHGGHGAPVVL